MAGRNNLRRTQLNPALNNVLGRSYQCDLPPLEIEWLMWFGKIRNTSMSEAISTAITVNGISAIIEPKAPPTNTSPTKASTVVMVEEKTGAAMRCAALIEAITGVSPLCRALKSACSATTMASSTTMPSAMISAKSDIMLMVSPAAYITPTAASMATGIPIATQNAVRALKNRNSISSTSPSPITPFSSRISSRSVISSARELISSIFTSLGSISWKSAAAVATMACIEMASPSSERSTRTSTAGCSPL